jgi:peroxiredoxin
VELQSQVEELQTRGIGLAVISYDPVDVLTAFSQDQGITFPLLSDLGSETIRRFGILNSVPEWALGPNSDDPAVAADVATYVSVVNPRATMIGIAFPGTFVLDPDGSVASRYFETFYIERNTVSSIVMRLGEGETPVDATKISTPQLDITTYPSDREVAPGNSFSLALNVEPGPGMHVYAPGATGYRVIALRVDPQPFVRIRSMEYPESSTYYFEPLDETVPVYEEPFTLIQEVVLEGTPRAQAAFRGQEALTLSGTIEYQACDDSICYTPNSVPVSWSLPLRPLSRFARP